MSPTANRAKNVWEFLKKSGDIMAEKVVRRLVYLLVASVFAMCTPHAIAQNYPARPIRIIVPFAPGGATDAVARMLAPRLSENLGQSVVVDNRGGGASTIGMDLVAKSAPDGYTLGVANLSFAVNPSLLSKLPYNTERDFALVGLVAKVPLVLSVHPSVPVKSIKELIAFAKARPGAMNYSSSGNGSATQMATELFRYMAGINIVHVPYTGGGPALVSVLSGQVSIYFGGIPALLPHFQSGKLRGLGVTSTTRDPAIPDIPSIAEALPGYEAGEWNGIVAPAGTPAAIVSRLNQEIVKTLTAPDVSNRFAAVGAHPVGSTPEEFAAYVKKESATWSKVVKAANIRLD
jgi:tripartite-type tricarboxylate transporter receptor subunit TctC